MSIRNAIHDDEDVDGGIDISPHQRYVDCL